MKKQLPLRRKKANGNGIDPDEHLSEFQAVEYARAHGFHLPIGRLRMSRLRNPRSVGPRFLKVDGHHVRYTPALLDEYLAEHAPAIIDPADRMRERAS